MWIKMICISNDKPKSNGVNLTIGEVYEVLPMMSHTYGINQNLYSIRYSNIKEITNYYWEKELFINLSEYREQQINNIIND